MIIKYLFVAVLAQVSAQHTLLITQCQREFPLKGIHILEIETLLTMTGGASAREHQWNAKCALIHILSVIIVIIRPL